MCACVSKDHRGGVLSGTRRGCYIQWNWSYKWLWVAKKLVLYKLGLLCSPQILKDICIPYLIANNNKQNCIIDIVFWSTSISHPMPPIYQVLNHFMASFIEEPLKKNILFSRYRKNTLIYYLNNFYFVNDGIICPIRIYICMYIYIFICIYKKTIKNSNILPACLPPDRRSNLTSLWSILSLLIIRDYHTLSVCKWLGLNVFQNTVSLV